MNERKINSNDFIETKPQKNHKNIHKFARCLDFSLNNLIRRNTERDGIDIKDYNLSSINISKPTSDDFLIKIEYYLNGKDCIKTFLIKNPKIEYKRRNEHLSSNKKGE